MTAAFRLRLVGYVGVVAFAFLGFLVPSAAAAFPAGFEAVTVTGGLNLPTAVAFAPDGRIFIAEKSGAVRIFHDGDLHPDPLIQLTDINDYADHGLLGIALDPNFPQNGYVYLLYTFENDASNYTGPKTGRLIRVTAVGDSASELTKVILLGTIGGDSVNPSCENFAVTDDCIPSDSPSHSVGGLRFGPDGKLYVSLGDGAHYDFMDPRALRAQNLDSLGGKILRINTDGAGVSDNPFYNGDVNANRSKVFTLGHRNSYRFNFRPATGMLYIGDVGWYSYEEVDTAHHGGENFGWPCQEGFLPTPAYDCTVPGATDPLYAYAHDANGTGSVTGGDFPASASYPGEYNDTYFFGDFTQDFIKRIVVDASDNLLSVEDFMTGAGGPVEIVAGPDGDIYYLSIYSGELRHIRYTIGNRQPIAVASASPGGGNTPLIVQFSSAGSSDPDGDPLIFSWDFGDGATSTDANPQYTYTINGIYQATLTVSDGQGGSGSAIAPVVVGNLPPTATVVNPVKNASYVAGQVIQLAGSGEDPELGPLSGDNLRWQIILHHNIHFHLLQELTGTHASFIAPAHNADGEQYIEVVLTATDSAGLTDTKSVNMHLDIPVPTGSYKGEYYSNPLLSGDPSMVRSDPLLDFNWGVGPPTPLLLGIDQFSARFTGDFDLATGTYRFFATGDDGIRLFVDGALLIDKWIDQAATEYSADVTLTGGTHRIRLEYYEAFGDAIAKLRWDFLGGAIGTFAPRRISTVVAPSSPATGASTTITAQVTNSGDVGNALIDFEVFFGGTRVHQEFFDNEAFAASSTREFSTTLVPVGAGEYRVALGLIHPGWAGLYEWTNDALRFTAGGVPPPPPPSGIPHHVSTLATPDAVSPGGSTSIETNIRNDGLTAPFVLDIEIFDGAGAQVAQFYREGETIPVGEAKSYIFPWIAPAQVDIYRVAIGLVHDGWSGLYEWTNGAEFITVSTVPPPPPPTGENIYTDVLAAGWASWSWDTTTDFAATPAATGSAAIAVTYSAPWAGLYLHHDGVDTSGWTNLVFLISGSTAGGQRLQIVPFNSVNAALTPVWLDSYLPAGGIPAGSWITVEIPLADLGIAGVTFTGFAVQGSSGAIEPAYLIDEIRIR